ncbi:hypothetical protein ACF0H5_019519 [Mactra antiquata]
MLTHKIHKAVQFGNLLHKFEHLTIRGCHHAVTTGRSPPQYVFHTPSLSMYHEKYLKNHEQLSLVNAVAPYNFISKNETTNIGDKVNTNISYECPKISDLNVEIEIPTSSLQILPLIEIPRLREIEHLTPGFDTNEKLCTNDLMRIRRRGMKKHRRKRTRKKLWPLIKKRAYLKLQKKIKARAQVIEKLKTRNSNMDPLRKIRASLDFARQRGYYVDLFSDEAGSRFIQDVEKKKEIEKLKSLMQSRKA